MNRSLLKLVPILIILGIIGIIYYISTDLNPGLMQTKPPTPPDAQDITESPFQPIEDGQIRQITFLTNMTKEQIQT